MVRLLTALLLLLLTCSIAKANKMLSVWDEANHLEFLNEIALANSAPQNSTILCPTSDQQGGESKSNSQTIRAVLGPSLKSISVLKVGNFETRDRFSLAQQAISDALQKSPKTLYRHQPWANAVKPDFVARLNYSGGKTGDLFMTYGYLCFQDESGTHWWTRFTMPQEQNLAQVRGLLGFESPHGYYIERMDDHRIWLQVTEAKGLVRDLQTLLGKSVVAEGELRTVPKHVTMNIPSGADYMPYGFTVRKADSNH